MAIKSIATTLAAAVGSVAAVSIAEINGNRFLSPLQNTTVTGLKGLVTAISKDGVYLRSTEPDDDPATSEGLYVYGKTIVGDVTVGDIVTLDGRVVEYRSSPDHFYLTELGSPQKLAVVSSDNKVTPLVIGVDTLSPPTEDFSSLDESGVFGVPNAASRISVANPKLDPESYGMDFWESLVGELVTIKDAYQVSRPNQYGEVWVRGDWKVTGLNEHGGLTMLDGDANPEAIIIGSPVDGSKNPGDTKMGDYLGDVSGIVSNAFGFYRVLPLEAVAPVKNATADHPAVSFQSQGKCQGLTFANYNARNLDPKSKFLPGVASQIVDKMATPDVIFLQEIQDNSGEKDDGVVAGNQTLAALSTAIEDASGVVYDFVEVVPADKEDGGAPGGNIRQAYLYRSDVVELWEPKQGSASDANEVLKNGKLKFNPGRIDPENPAWEDSRKPLVAAWKPKKGKGKPFFTANVHFGSKGGSSTLHGDPRPPVNKGVDIRTKQAEVTGDFIAQILKKRPGAAVVVAGDFNEFTQVEPIKVFMERSGLLDLDDVTDVPPAERYTYLFDMNSQALDHMFVSPAARKGAKYEHLHLNTWQSYNDQISDHDPSVARLNVCGS